MDIRVLHVLPSLTWCGGIESYVMNYYRHINREKIQFDFITHGNFSADIVEEIENMGGRVYNWEKFNLSKIPKLMKKINEFFCDNQGVYTAIHCHMANGAMFYFPVARKYGVKKLILHSHNNRAAAIRSHALRNIPLLWIGNKLATHRLACTYDAGHFLFGDCKFEIIKNAIEVKKFLYNEEIREKIRKKYNWANDFIIGHVGRLNPQKNQIYLLEIFKYVLKKEPTAKLILIGEGEDYNCLKKRAQELGVDNRVEFLGSKSNIYDFYQAFDVFVFPSLYEGLGMVLIEAQLSGLHTFASEKVIPYEAKVSDLLQFLPLDAGAEYWAEKILTPSFKSPRKSPLEDVERAGYDVKIETEKMEKFYLQG